MGNYVNRLASRFASNFVSKHPKNSDEKPETNKSQNTVLLPKPSGGMREVLGSLIIHLTGLIMKRCLLWVFM